MSSNKQARRILITAGPAVAEIDRVRKITNHSTGALGSTLTRIAQQEGHQVTLLRSEYCTTPEPDTDHQLIPFRDGDSLMEALQAIAKTDTFDAVWHAAAVTDYVVDFICDENGNRLERDAKLASRAGNLTLHLKPFMKIIHQLQTLFPQAQLVGWKYETDGTTDEVIGKALQQLTDNHTDACVANGPAFHSGAGFGVCISKDVIIPAADSTELAMVLLGLLEAGEQ